MPPTYKDFILHECKLILSYMHTMPTRYSRVLDCFAYVPAYKHARIMPARYRRVPDWLRGRPSEAA